jgi:biopolymer transport protein ExbD
MKAFDEFGLTLKKPEISMAPLIDMVFLLLIFFVVTTTFTKETGIKVDKARATTAQIIHKNLMVVSIDKDGNYWTEGAARALDDIVGLVVESHQKNDELNVVVVPDKRAAVEPLIALLDKLRASNISRFSIGTQLSDQE